MPFIVLLAYAFGWARGHTVNPPPRTRTDEVKEKIHGVEIRDAYRWLEDGESPETREWIHSQNEYTESVIGKLPGREALKGRLTELMRTEWRSAPLVRNGRYFFHKREADQELSVLCMRKGWRGKDEVVVDPHPMSPDQTTSVAIRDVSEDGTLLAYAVREGGQDECAIELLDVETSKHLPDRLSKGRYFSFSLRPDKSGYYYVRHGTEGSRVYYHAMGTEAAGDTEVFGEGYGADKGIGAELSEEGRYLLITVWHGSAAERTEVYCQDVTKEGPIVPIVNDVNARFQGQVGGDALFMQTDWKAPKGRIFRVDLKSPGREHWQEVIPENDAVMEGYSLAGGKLFVQYLENVSSRVKVFDGDGKHVRDIPLPAIGSVGSISSRWTSDEAFFGFSSFNVPPTIYQYGVAEGNNDVWWRLDVPLRDSTMEVKQVRYKSKDNTEVPMFVVHAKGIRLDGSNPTLLTGYGGFNASLTPWFSPQALVWVESGGVYAVANLRGGGEFGEEWHRAGMFENKQNVFDDFIAAAEWLIGKGYTRSEKLGISGGSNGGLLVGAAFTQRPELFQAVVCHYPLLDMLRYHKFLLGRLWISEYGSSEEPEQFRYIYAYSPYHRVKAGTKYPAVFFVTGDADTRVAPLHARKMAALLQSATGSHNPVLLRYHTKAGHSGGQPLREQIEDMTDQLSFLFWQLGMTPPTHLPTDGPLAPPER